ncbi:MAG: hypothetical protein CMM47_09980 [Rhodospirillaceae bacterium]|nr:hypothetical protein [Rhodospirillaceae bacterium]
MALISKIKPDDQRLGSLPLFLSLFLLLLAFFIFLNSISSLETGKSVQVLASIRSSFPGFGVGGDGTGIVEDDKPGRIEQSIVVRLEEAFAVAINELEIRIINEANRIHVDVPIVHFFAPGGAEPRAALGVLSDRLSAVLVDPSPRQRLETRILLGRPEIRTAYVNRLELDRADQLIGHLLVSGSPPVLTSVGVEPGHPGHIRFSFRAVGRNHGVSQ